MGHHYVPQRYLRNFECVGAPGNIWTFDKKSHTRKLLPIDKVAQAKAFYTPDEERELAFKVEMPANAVIEKLIHGETLDEASRADLTYYVACMVRRVPHTRQRAYTEFAPLALSECVEDVREKLRQMASQGKLTAAQFDERLAWLTSVSEKLAETLPEEVEKQIRCPWPSESWVGAIDSMYWRVLHAEGSEAFVTSDNPAYFFQCYGFARQGAEVTLPLSSKVLLHCSWTPGPDVQHLPTTDRMVKSLNRRTASGATRFVFFHTDATWIHSLAQNQVDQLDLIAW